MKIRIGFSTTDKYLSKAIRLFTKSDLSHTYIRVNDTFLKAPLIIHSDFSGAVIQHAEAFDLENKIIQEYEIDDSRLDDILGKNLWWLLGKKYDWKKVFNHALFIILRRWVVRKIRNPTVNPRKLICVDFILYIFNAAGITDLPIGYLTPKDLYDWCEANWERLGWKKILNQHV